MAGKKRIKASNRGEGSFRLTTSGSVEYRISYKNEAGERKSKSFTGVDEQECREKADAWFRRRELERRGVDLDATIAEIMKHKYRSDFEMNYLTEAGYCRNIDSLKIIEKGSIGSAPIYDITKADMDAYLKTLTVYSNSVIEKVFQQLRGAFNIAMEKRIITVNIMTASDMRCPKSSKPDKKVRGLTIDEQKRLVDQMEIKAPPEGRNDYRLQLFIELYSGMRMGEINALRGKDIDLKKNVIHVHSTISRGIEYRPFVKDTTKTYNGMRDIPISKKLRPYLEEALRRQKPNPHDLLFYDLNTKSVITTNQVNSYFQRTCQKADIPRYGQHALRHTFATRCIESGIPAVVLKTWLGHKDIHVTLDTYTDVFKEMDHNAVEKLDQYIDAM